MTNTTPSPVQRDALEALAVRCEQASGGDRELDAAIATAMGDTRAVGYVFNAAFVRHHVPAYSASLDAAMTLVPEGASWSLYDVIGKRESVRMWGAETDVLCAAATPALALCAASLRARSLALTSGETE